MSFLRNSAAAAAFLACSFAAGCGADPNFAEVSGSISYDGKPIESGQMSFFPIGGRGTTTGCYIEKGTYKAKVSFGEIEVKVHVPKIIGKRKLYPTDPKSPEAEDAIEGMPARYNTKTELKLTVKESVVKKDFDLKK